MANDPGGPNCAAAKIKNSTHALAAALFAGILWLGHFAASPAGQALVKQYPALSALAGVLAAATAAAGLYYSPKS